MTRRWSPWTVPSGRGSRRHLALFLGLALGGLATAACDEAEFDAADFEDGARKLTTRGAFQVELWSAGANPRPGLNDFVLEVAMPDPARPEALGWGIPDARITATALMPGRPGIAGEAQDVRYLGDGRYLIHGLPLSQPGAWALTFDIEVGATMDEQVTFTFEL